MFERFTDRARYVLVLAQEEARLLGHQFIGTEHILLGLLHEGEGLAAQALTLLGVTLDAAREKVAETIGPVKRQAHGSPPFTPRARKLLELSLREQLELGHNGIDTEHMLLGLVRQGESVAISVLRQLAVEPDVLRQRLRSLMNDPGYFPSTEGVVNQDSGSREVEDNQPGRELHGDAFDSRRPGPRPAPRRMQLPRWLVAMIDPAQGYMERNSPRRHRRHPPMGVASYGPLSTDPRRKPPDAEFAPLRDRDRMRRQNVRERNARLDALMETYRAAFESGTQELLERGRTVMSTPLGTFSARIVRFRWGDSVLEIERSVRTEKEIDVGVRLGQGVSMTNRVRLPRAAERADVLTQYLVGAFAELPL